jgi:hypothetical protein
MTVLSTMSIGAQETLISRPVTPADAVEWREDLRSMSAEMRRRHNNLFHDVTETQFDSAVGDLSRRIPSLARHEIIVAMARIAAMIGDGHTNVAPTRDPRIRFHTYPIQLYKFPDGLRVRAAAIDHADLVGWRVTGIGTMSIDRAYAAVRGIIGRDNEMDAAFFAPFLLVMPEVLHALGVIDDMNRAAFFLERDGTVRTVTLSPSGLSALFAPDTDTSWCARPGWRDARDGAEVPLPLWLRDPGDKYWFTCIPGVHTVYVQFNQVGDKQEESVAEFSSRLFKFVDTSRVDRFVLDLRLNRGGNGGLNRPLLLGMIKTKKINRPGHMFVIIGRATWSAAQFLINGLEEYTASIFVGEPSGGKVNSYGDSERITLPHSRITVRVSALWWQGDPRDRRQWTAPQIAAPLTFEEYASNRDPAMEAILSYTAGNPPR